MAYSPRTYNLFQNIDISNALAKAKTHFDNVKGDTPSICIKTDNPFALAMGFARYIRAFNEQMRDEVDIDETMFNSFKINHFKDFVRISFTVKAKKLELVNEQTGEKIWLTGIV